MPTREIIELALLGIVVLAGLISVIVALVRGDMKKFVEEKMVEAESLDLTGSQKLEFVLKAVREKYKVLELVLNIKKFVEHIIDLSKQINVK